MKKSFFTVLALVMCMLLMSSVVKAAAPTPRFGLDSYNAISAAATRDVADLMAGKTTNVGDVFIDQIDVLHYRVTYKIDVSDWYIKEIHFEGISGLTEMGLISSKGSIIPGRLSVNKIFDLSEKITEFSFVYNAVAAVTSFAAHAVVGTADEYTPGTTGTDNYVSDTTTMITSGNVPNASYPYSAVPTNAGPNYGIDTWINQTGTNSWLPTPPTWIWESNPVMHPIEGDVVWFEKTFNVLGTPVDGDLKIAVDNGYAVWLNGKFIGSDNLFQFVGADNVYPVYGDVSLGNLYQSFVDTSNWQTVGIFDLAPYLQEGNNVLKIMGVNEHMHIGDYTDPVGTTLLNPGGMAFQFDVDWQMPDVSIPGESETAWGTGVDAGTSNWSQIIANPF